jgi:hypothetical protein
MSLGVYRQVAVRPRGALMPTCERCAEDMPRGGTFTTSGLLVCNRCAALASIAEADARVSPSPELDEACWRRVVAVFHVAKVAVWVGIPLLVVRAHPELAPGVLALVVVIPLLRKLLRGDPAPRSTRARR